MITLNRSIIFISCLWLWPLRFQIKCSGQEMNWLLNYMLLHDFVGEDLGFTPKNAPDHVPQIVSYGPVRISFIGTSQLRFYSHLEGRERSIVGYGFVCNQEKNLGRWTVQNQDTLTSMLKRLTRAETTLENSRRHLKSLTESRKPSSDSEKRVDVTKNLQGRLRRIIFDEERRIRQIEAKIARLSNDDAGV